MYHDIEEAAKALPNNNNEINTDTNTSRYQHHNVENSTNDASGNSEEL